MYRQDHGWACTGYGGDYMDTDSFISGDMCCGCGGGTMVPPAIPSVDYTNISVWRVAINTGADDPGLNEDTFIAQTIDTSNLLSNKHVTGIRQVLENSDK